MDPLEKGKLLPEAGQTDRQNHSLPEKKPMNCVHEQVSVRANAGSGVGEGRGVGEGCRAGEGEGAGEVLL